MATGCDLADEISIPWLDFVSEACGPDGEMASALQAAVGASAFGHNREHRVEVLCGDGGTGKSTFAETISAALGGYAGVLPASVGGWFEVRCEKSATSETAAAELYRDYCAWCEEEGMRKASRTAWGTAVGRRATKRRASRGFVYAVVPRV